MYYWLHGYFCTILFSILFFVLKFHKFIINDIIFILFLRKFWNREIVWSRPVPHHHRRYGFKQSNFHITCGENQINKKKSWVSKQFKVSNQIFHFAWFECFLSRQLYPRFNPLVLEFSWAWLDWLRNSLAKTPTNPRTPLCGGRFRLYLSQPRRRVDRYVHNYKTIENKALNASWGRPKNLAVLVASIWQLYRTTKRRFDAEVKKSFTSWQYHNCTVWAALLISSWSRYRHQPSNRLLGHPRWLSNWCSLFSSCKTFFFFEVVLFLNRYVCFGMCVF